MCVLVDANRRKAVEISLNSDKISRQRNQVIESFVRLQLIIFIKVDFQAGLSKRKGIISFGGYPLLYFFNENFQIAARDNLQNQHVERNLKFNFLVKKYPFLFS